MVDSQPKHNTLSQDERRRLIEAARTARERAYAPYSKFAVGAAVLIADGSIISGCNVENSSTGLTNCAERVAIQSAVAAGHRDILAIAISVSPAAKSRQENMPCGACRQVMAEFMAPTGLIIIDGIGDFSIETILPDPFILQLS